MADLQAFLTMTGLQSCREKSIAQRDEPLPLSILTVHPWVFHAWVSIEGWTTGMGSFMLWRVSFAFRICKSGGTDMKKLDARSRVKRKPGGISKARNSNAELIQRLEDLSEKFDLVLPEVTARVAALEHLLREKQLVTRQDLVSARSFVRLQEE
jgi:hypothetical protein